MEDVIPHCPFSRFAAELLSKGQIKSALYHLQHRAGFNINLIFYLLWLAKGCYGRVTKRQIQLLYDQVALWHQRVIAELKYTYALVANHTNPTIVSIQHALEAEIAKAHLIEQHMLYAVRLKTRVLRRSSQQQLVDACVNIAHYCEFKNDLLIMDDQMALCELLQNTFDTIDSNIITQQVQNSLQHFAFSEEKPIQTRWQEL